MQAVEFQTNIRNGIIELPEAHKERFQGQVRVILLAAEESQLSVDMIAQLLSNPLHIAGFKPLTRDEIYGRQA
jgi:hypothetical protein